MPASETDGSARGSGPSGAAPPAVRSGAAAGGRSEHGQVAGRGRLVGGWQPHTAAQGWGRSINMRRRRRAGAQRPVGRQAGGRGRTAGRRHTRGPRLTPTRARGSGVQRLAARYTRGAARGADDGRGGRTCCRRGAPSGVRVCRRYGALVVAPPDLAADSVGGGRGRAVGERPRRAAYPSPTRQLAPRAVRRAGWRGKDVCKKKKKTPKTAGSDAACPLRRVPRACAPSRLRLGVSVSGWGGTPAGRAGGHPPGQARHGRRPPPAASPAGVARP